MNPAVLQLSALLSPAINFSVEITYVTDVGLGIIMQILQSAVEGTAYFSLSGSLLVCYTDGKI